MRQDDQENRGRGRPPLLAVLARVDEEVRFLRDSLGGLPRAVEADHILREIWIDDVHNSTAIEGNTMTRAQVENLVDKGRASGTLLESVEVRAYADAADWVYRWASDHRGVPLAVVSEVHKIVVGLPWQIDPPTTRDTPGAWRSVGVRVGHVAVSTPAALPADLDEWSGSTAEVGQLHPIVHAAKHHAWFERIHPFVDGNGRVGRLILNFLLIQRGYPPAVIEARHRARYIGALRTADGGNPHPLAEIVARAVSGALSRLLIPKLTGSAKLVPLSALSAQSTYATSYLRNLVRDGRLRAIRDGGLWLSSMDWLAEYVRDRDPRGAPAGFRIARPRARSGDRKPRPTTP